MSIWNQAPLVRLLFPFLAGILSAIYSPVQIDNYFLIILPYLAIIVVFVFIPAFRITYKRSWIFGLLANVLLFATAYQLTIYKTEKFNDDHFQKRLDTEYVFHARIIQSPVEKERSYKMTAEILSVRTRNKWQSCSGTLMLYLKKNTNASLLKYGDELVIKETINEISPVKNPGEFDYRRFLAFHNINHQCSADSSGWVSTDQNSGNFILQYSFKLRDALLKILSDNGISGDEYAVGAALMLGYSDMLDADIISAYSSTGALHVLSVSGLHVAIVYVVFNMLLFFLAKLKHGNIIKAVILIILLWFYSALTGLSPSVLRASTMFSFIIVGKAFSRYTNIYNTLAASAFLLLAINPFLIMEVGFQLSYIAVIGIVYLQPKIYNWYEPTNWFFDQVWTITAVSIAAQIATFPLGLLYFHQFPNYFLLSNFIVIPVSTIIIYLGIALFVLSKISVIAAYLSLGFKWSVWFLNESVKTIEKWPNALLEGISISVLETWLLYSVILLFLYYFVHRNIRSLYLALGSVILILISQIIEQQQQFRQSKLVVYSVPRTTAIDFISSRSNTLYTDTVFAKNGSSLLFHVKHNWWDLGVKYSTVVTKDLYKTNLIIKKNVVLFCNRKIVVLDHSSARHFQTINNLNVDYLIISKNTKSDLKEAIRALKPKQLIFDSSNSRYLIEKWKDLCEDLQQPYYSVPESGAFVADL
ncbi:MAG: ComEC/Rec2-related protein [Bacteroidota bacterium]|jgi:competence protein ComEC|nr:ComEC/Rec2-related protein [Bacteroidota bacterium]